MGQRRLLHQEAGAATLDLARDLAMQVRGHAGDAAGQNLAAFGHEFFEQIRILVVDRFDRNVDAAARHGAVSATESGTAFGCFRLHGGLFGLAMERMLPQEPIVFFLLQAIGGPRSFLVSAASAGSSTG